MNPRVNENPANHLLLVRDAARQALKHVTDIRLPLHILLENHFGDLNENQEELVEAARKAAETANDEFLAIAELAELELGHIELRRDRLFPADLVYAILGTIQAQATECGIKFESFVEPLVPAINSDSLRLERSLVVLLTSRLRSAAIGSGARLSLSNGPDGARIELQSSGQSTTAAVHELARCVLTKLGARIHEDDRSISIVLA